MIAIRLDAVNRLVGSETPTPVPARERVGGKSAKSQAAALPARGGQSLGEIHPFRFAAPSLAISRFSLPHASSITCRRFSRHCADVGGIVGGINSGGAP